MLHRLLGLCSAEPVFCCCYDVQKDMVSVTFAWTYRMTPFEANLFEGNDGT